MSGEATTIARDSVGRGVLLGVAAILAGGLACVLLQYVAFSGFGSQSPWRLIFLLLSLAALLAGPALAVSGSLSHRRFRSAGGIGLATAVGLPLWVWLTS